MGILLTTFLLIFILHSSLYSQNRSSGTLIVQVQDATDKQPLSFTTVAIPDLNKFQYTNQKGTITYPDLPYSTYELTISRVGYQTLVQKVPMNQDTVFVPVLLSPTPIESETVVIEGKHKDESSTITGDSDYVISGKKLRQNLGTTIASTIEGEPGMAQRSMGPAPARPVLRGLGGDRLKMVEDGTTTGDLSATSNDHAVAIDPLGAQGIEIYRGPEALQFGSNTLAGVINVENFTIPTSLPSQTQTVTSLQGQSVNTGMAGGVHVTAPLKSLVVDVNGSIRNANDTSTPDGTLDNTELFTRRGSIGTSLIQPWGFVGVSAGLYLSDYGIPGGFVGAHPNGVDIELQREQYGIKGQYLPDISWIHHLDLDLHHTRYFHQEYESNGSLGMEFGVLTSGAKLSTHFEEFSWGTLTFGIDLQHRNYATGGATFTPNAVEQDLAAFLYHEVSIDEWDISASLRGDSKTVTPDQTGFLEEIGEVRERSFLDWSAALEVGFNLTDHWTLGTRGMRTFKAPGIEELFSKGPHLAAYSYEIGNANLGTEHGMGIDVFTSYHLSNLHVEITGYHNRINGYIYPENTGERANRRNDLFLYQFRGQEASFWGAEGHFDWRFSPNWSTNATFSYVHGQLVSEDQPVPYIPPFSTRWKFSYNATPLTGYATISLTSDQNRTGEFEEPTDGYALLGAGVEYVIDDWGGMYILTLSVQNLLDTTYRNHLSRVKSVMPEPGRNIKLTVKSYF